MQDPIAPLEVMPTNEAFVRVFDALDMTDAEVEEYRASRDPALLKLKSDREPVLFVIQRLPPSYTIALARLDGATCFKSAFLAACHKIKLPGGAELAPKPKSIKNVGRPGVSAPDDDWVDVVADRWGIDTVIEVGRVAFEFARMPADPAVRGPFSW